jgi:histidinol-phosphatase (PHP family)
MIWTNFHSHTGFSDGVKEPEEHLLAAINQGMPAYGFSDHSPIPFPSSWSIQSEDFTRYCQIIDDLKEKYADKIQVYKGLEMDFIPGHFDTNAPVIRAANLDYTVGSIHFTDFYDNGVPWEIDGTHKSFLKGLAKIFDNDIRRMVERYYELTREMIQHARPDVLGHMDKIKIQSEDGELFDENAPWYRKAVMETLEAAQKADLIIEVNTRGVYKKTSDLYPSLWILKEIKRMGIKIMMNSDSHHPRELTRLFPETALQLREMGFTKLWSLWHDQWQPFDFDQNGLIMP